MNIATQTIARRAELACKPCGDSAADGTSDDNSLRSSVGYYEE